MCVNLLCFFLVEGTGHEGKVECVKMRTSHLECAVLSKGLDAFQVSAKGGHIMLIKIQKLGCI